MPFFEINIHKFYLSRLVRCEFKKNKLRIIFTEKKEWNLNKIQLFDKVAVGGREFDDIIKEPSHTRKSRAAFHCRHFLSPPFFSVVFSSLSLSSPTLTSLSFSPHAYSPIHSLSLSLRVVGGREWRWWSGRSSSSKWARRLSRGKVLAASGFLGVAAECRMSRWWRTSSLRLSGSRSPFTLPFASSSWRCTKP